MPRFVLLEHDHPHAHYDLMLEFAEVLWTWRLPSLPRPGAVQVVERVFDHRLLYLDYEGPVSGGRGNVMRRDQGMFDWLMRAEDRLEVRLDGETLRALLKLIQIDGSRWRLECVG